MVTAAAAADVLRNLRRELVMDLPDKLFEEAIDLQSVYQESTWHSGLEAAAFSLSGKCMNCQNPMRERRINPSLRIGF